MTGRPGLPDVPSWPAALGRLVATALVGGFAFGGVLVAGLAVLTG